jgi:hypothetical protein
MAAQITKDTTLSELETIVGESVSLMKKAGLPFDEARIRKDLRTRLAEVKGVKPEDLEALEAPAPVAAAVEPPKPVAKRSKEDALKKLRGSATSNANYFWEKPEDTAATDMWIGINRSAGVRINLINVGPAGCGKTEGIKLASLRAGLPFYKVDCASITTSDKWIGHKEIDEKGTHFVMSEHLEWLEAKVCEPGVLLYDEINRLHPSLLNLLIPILDGSQSIWVPDMNKRIDVHPDTLIAATANFGVGFSGTYSLDVAISDRFGMILERGFPPETEEVKILEIRTGVDKASAVILVDIAKAIRRKFDNEEISKPVSTRALLNTSTYVVAGMSVLEAIEYTWLKGYSDLGGAQSERAQVRVLVTGKTGGR